MALESKEQITALESASGKILELPHIRFAGIINKMGRLIVGNYKKGVKSLIDDKQDRTLYMQMALEFSMRKDFDETLGSIDYIATRRKRVIMISIPLGEYMLLVSAEPEAKIGDVFKNAKKIFAHLNV